MSTVQIDDLYCKCDGKYGLGELDMRTGKYICSRCSNGGKE